MEFLSDDRFLQDCKWLKELFDRFEKNDPVAHLKPIETSIREKKTVDNSWFTGKKLSKLNLAPDSPKRERQTQEIVFESWDSPYMLKLVDLSCGPLLEKMFKDAEFNFKDWALKRHKSRSLQDFIDDEIAYGDGFCSSAAAALFFHEKEFEECKINHPYYSE